MVRGACIRRFRKAAPSGDDGRLWEGADARHGVAIVTVSFRDDVVCLSGMGVLLSQEICKIKQAAVAAKKSSISDVDDDGGDASRFVVKSAGSKCSQILAWRFVSVTSRRGFGREVPAKATGASNLAVDWLDGGDVGHLAMELSRRPVQAVIL